MKRQAARACLGVATECDLPLLVLVLFRLALGGQGLQGGDGIDVVLVAGLEALEFLDHVRLQFDDLVIASGCRPALPLPGPP